MILGRALIILIFLSSSVYAKKIQIIHTNDLHSYFKGYDDNRGGYDRVKTLIDWLKNKAHREGIDSIVLDGGDFGEGAHYYLYNGGIESFKLLGDIGVDVAVIGNHDYMFGGYTLSKQIKEAGVETAFVGANIMHTHDMALKGLLQPSVRFEVGGVKMEIIGLTTNTLHYMHHIRPGLILPPNEVSKAYSKIAREDEMDMVVALTHIGLSKDKSLVKADPNIDVVIGGHSHTRLEEVVYQKNKEGRQIPIVQTGAHGIAVGSLILDYNGPKDVEVVSYQLYDTEGLPRDPSVQRKIEEIDTNTKNELALGRWDEVIGDSQVPLTGYVDGKHNHDDPCWTEKHLPNVFLEGTKGDVGLYLGIFAGKYIPPGPVTVGDIIEQFPHAQTYGQEGWEVMTFDVKGYQLYAILSALVNVPYFMGSNGVLLGGMDYKTYTFPKVLPWIGGKKIFTRFRVKGRKFRFRSKYKIALPYELSVMVDKLLPKFLRKYIPTKFERGNHFLWPMAENYIRKNSPLSCD
jgi:2',3'-cyclic-nucleotide 2'-phosphodiesterase (5'-nucleotidase family)